MGGQGSGPGVLLVKVVVRLSGPAQVLKQSVARLASATGTALLRSATFCLVLGVVRKPCGGSTVAARKALYESGEVALLPSSCGTGHC